MNTMEYTSTRGSKLESNFEDVLLRGMAPDGGLFMPKWWPTKPAPAKPRTSDSYAETAFRVMWPFVVGTIPESTFRQIISDAYATFDDPAVCPVSDLGSNYYLLELYHGPTLAFKDVALQLVGRLMAYYVNKSSRHVTNLIATSGDTGSAGIHACLGQSNLSVVVAFPTGRVSEVQRRQMTTVNAPNVRCVAVEGNFDDCQKLVKACFDDPVLRDKLGLSGMNSLNWGRVMAQIVYYVTAAATVCPNGEPVRFSVPSGNFGDALAGWIASMMGLPIDQLVLAVNKNDALVRWLNTGHMENRGAEASLSVSMDVDVPSNFERLLYYVNRNSGPATKRQMEDYAATGRLQTSNADLQAVIWPYFDGTRVSDKDTLVTMRRVFEDTGRLIDPHTAVGLAAAQKTRPNSDTPNICLSTAHPAKFPATVEKATGVTPPLPDSLQGIYDLPEQYTTIPNDLAAFKKFLLAT